MDNLDTPRIAPIIGTIFILIIFMGFLNFSLFETYLRHTYFFFFSR